MTLEAGLLVFDREAQLAEAVAEHGLVVIEREEQIAEIVGMAVAIMKHDGVVDHERD